MSTIKVFDPSGHQHEVSRIWIEQFKGLDGDIRMLSGYSITTGSNFVIKVAHIYSPEDFAHIMDMYFDLNEQLKKGGNNVR